MSAQLELTSTQFHVMVILINHTSPENLDLPTAPIGVLELILKSRNEACPEKAEDPMTSANAGMSIRTRDTQPLNP
jgi:hypothetical protein